MTGRSRGPAKRRGLARKANLLYMHGVLLDAPTEVEVAGRVTMAYSTHREATTGANVILGHSLSFGSALVFVRSVETNPAEFLAQVRDEVMQGREFSEDSADLIREGRRRRNQAF